MMLRLDGKDVGFEGDDTILDICTRNNIRIPTLCHQEGLKPPARCRICLVEMDGRLVTSCSTKPHDGAVVETHSPRAVKGRKMNIELMMSGHENPCNVMTDFKEMCGIFEDTGLESTRYPQLKDYKTDIGTSVVRDDNKCINCGRCIDTCQQIQEIYAIEFASRGHNEHVAPYCDKDLADVACIKCGQCIINCPVGAITEREHLSEVLELLKDKKKDGRHIVVQTAPSIRVSLGEEFDMEPGTVVTGKMVAALRRCGFDKVFDVDLGADMTIMEEATEFLKRLENGGPFPMITTCCPGWILMMEHFYHELVAHMSTCRSPHEMLGILTKTYYAEKLGIPKDKIVVVSVMPCTAKKYESTRPELDSSVDFVLTTRELGKLIRLKEIDFRNLHDEEFDPALGMATGAGAIFGASGGVMEAALRTAYKFGTGDDVTKLEFDQIRGMQGIKKGSMLVGKREIRFAVAHGGANIRKLLEEREKYHFIEFMACPGGCIGGGGQPIPTTDAIRKQRMEGLYNADSHLTLRRSHDNPIVKKIYSEYLDKPGSKRAHRILHTRYFERSQF